MTNTSASQSAVSQAKGLYPFTFREYGVFGVVVLLLIASILPLGGRFSDYAYYTIWSLNLLGVVVVLTPIAAAALLALRRLVPSVRWRVGSLSVDQFASVIFVITGITYLMLLIAFPGAGSVLGFIFALAGIVPTTLAKFIPLFAVEFTERAESTAHVMARLQVLPLAKPKQPVYSAPSTTQSAAPATSSVPSTPPSQPFWVLSPEKRPVVDDKGETVFTIDSTAWVAAIEDHGSELVIRAEDGRTGVLKNIDGISRA